jgi:hypothetical protein
MFWCKVSGAEFEIAPRNCARVDKETCTAYHSTVSVCECVWVCVPLRTKMNEASKLSLQVPEAPGTSSRRQSKRIRVQEKLGYDQRRNRSPGCFNGSPVNLSALYGGEALQAVLYACETRSTSKRSNGYCSCFIIRESRLQALARTRVGLD